MNIELNLDVPATTWCVHVDRQELELALVNLVVNAKDAMPEGGQISIKANNIYVGPHEGPNELIGEFVSLSVSDTGSGIPDDILPRVFEPFFTTKAADKGTGLGLSQVYAFAHRSGGAVDIRSQLKLGTTISIYMPRAQTEAEMPPLKETEEDLALAGEGILVVEDNSEVRQVTVTLLEELGYHTMQADSADTALAMLSASRSDINLVFSDMILPGETDGLTLAEAIRTHYPTIPVLLTTGYAKAFAAESRFPVLRKPYQIVALSCAVRKASQL